MLRLILLLMCVCGAQELSAGIEEYFKKPEGKTSASTMHNIDFVYMINLDERPEKYYKCIEKLRPFGVYPFRFSAVNGWTLPLEVINSVGVKYESWMCHDLWGTTYDLGDGNPHHEVMHVLGRNYFCHCMSQGAVAICLSHLSVLQDALDSGYKTIWVMEDDIEVVRDPNEMSVLVEKLDAQVGKDGWDILFTDPDTKAQNGGYVPCTSYARRPNFTPANQWRFAQREDISADFKKVGARYGAYSMIVRESGMRKILNFIKAHQIFLPYDMDFYLPDDIRMYSMRYDVVSTEPNALSDNGGPGYKQKK